MSLPPLIDIAEIRRRLKEIFPDGLAQRASLVSEMAARVVFVFLYGGMLEGTGRLLRPSHVYFFTHEQTELRSDDARDQWLEASTKPGFRPAVPVVRRHHA